MDSGFTIFGRVLIGTGALLVLLGAIFLLLGRFPGLGLGRLPGDIVVRRGDVSFYIPLGSCVLLSVFITLVLWAVTLLSRR